MSVVRNKKYLFLVLISVVILCVFLIYKNNSDNKTKLEQVKLSNEESVLSKDLFAIMISDEDGNYSESTSNIFPTEGYTYNEELSSCIDINGKIVNDILTYDTTNNLVTVSTDTTVYCYLYFDIEKYDFGEYLINNPTTGLNTTLEGGLYRYQGTSVNNYICFGTSDKNECLGNTDVYMYRIIGITEDGKIKVMKNYALNTTYHWHNTSSSNTTWPNSDLYKGLNGISGGEYSNLFLGNTTYMPTGWSDKIEDTPWKYGDNTNVNTTADSLDNIENGGTDTTNAKIGLIYVHDYSYTYQSGGLNCSSSGTYSTCKTSWMFISVSDSEAPSTHEWTMSRYGLSGSTYLVWRVNGDGYVSNSNMFFTASWSVRPVFYLKSTIQFLGGTGTSTSPFRIL